MHIQGPVIKQTIKPTIKLMTSLSLKCNVGPADLLGVVPHWPEVNGLTGDEETSADVSTWYHRPKGVYLQAVSGWW